MLQHLLCGTPIAVNSSHLERFTKLCPDHCLHKYVGACCAVALTQFPAMHALGPACACACGVWRVRVRARARVRVRVRVRARVRVCV